VTAVIFSQIQFSCGWIWGCKSHQTHSATGDILKTKIRYILNIVNVVDVWHLFGSILIFASVRTR